MILVVVLMSPPVRRLDETCSAPTTTKATTGRRVWDENRAAEKDVLSNTTQPTAN